MCTLLLEQVHAVAVQLEFVTRVGELEEVHDGDAAAGHHAAARLVEALDGGVGGEVAVARRLLLRAWVNIVTRCKQSLVSCSLGASPCTSYRAGTTCTASPARRPRRRRLIFAA